MENAQPFLTTTPVNLIILPASSSLQTLQPLTVITTTALGSLCQPMTTATLSSLDNNNNNTTSTALTTALPLSAVCTSAVAASTTALPSINPGSITKTFSGTPPLKPAKKFRSEQEEILRCKRRLDFIGSLGLQRPHATTVLRRNERERNRVKLINNTFVRLRDHLPGTTVKTSKGKAKKLSKVDTLQQAIDYIGALQTMIDEHDAVNAAFDNGVLAPSLERVSPTSSTASTSSLGDSDSLHSPGSAGESEVFSDEGAPLSPEEADLLDFTSWF